MAPLVGPHDERYTDFYTSWIKEQESLVKELQEALEGDMKEPELLQVVNKVAGHYEAYYKAKQSACHQDILQIMIPDWRSYLEKAFSWLGGWRPSLAFQLIYALVGQDIEAELAEFLEGVDTPTIAALTSAQLSRINDLQTATYKEEDNLSNDMAMLQQSLADQPLLSLAQANHMLQTEGQKIGRRTGSSQEGDSTHGDGGDDCRDQSIASSRKDTGSGGGHCNDGGNDDDADSLDNALQEKLRTLEQIATKADVLRFVTLQKVLDILNVYQKAQYLVSAGKLQIALRNIGQKMKEHTDA